MYRGLDGIPPAVEVAAAWMRVLIRTMADALPGGGPVPASCLRS